MTLFIWLVIWSISIAVAIFTPSTLHILSSGRWEMEWWSLNSEGVLTFTSYAFTYALMIVLSGMFASIGWVKTAIGAPFILGTSALSLTPVIRDWLSSASRGAFDETLLVTLNEPTQMQYLFGHITIAAIISIFVGPALGRPLFSRSTQKSSTKPKLARTSPATEALPAQPLLAELGPTESGEVGKTERTTPA